MPINREPLDLTDKELYYVALAIQTHLESRETWISKGGARVINSLIDKINTNGLKRKNPEKIIHPIYKFKEE